MATIPLSLGRPSGMFAQADARWPNRDHASDGAIGDAVHAGRASDHNPDYRGVVHADDLDRNLGPAVPYDALWLGIRIAQRGDPRVHYLVRGDESIGEDVIFNFEPRYVHAGWRRTGKRDHFSHLHISIWHSLAAEHDTSPWFDFLDGGPTGLPHTTIGDVMARQVGQPPNRLLRADTSSHVLFKVRTSNPRYRNAVYVSDLASYRRHVTDAEVDLMALLGTIALDTQANPVIVKRTVDEARALPLIGKRYKTTLR